MSNSTTGVGRRHDDVGPPSRVGHTVSLTPVDPASIDFLYQLAIDDQVGWRWRYTGAVPPRSAFEQSLWNGVLTQFVVRQRRSGAPIGCVMAYNSDINHGFTYVAAALVAEAVGWGVGIEAVDLFCGHLFGTYRLRKIYFEVPEYNVQQFGSSLDWLLKQEGCLVDHSFYQGRLWDRYLFAMYRDDYDAATPRRLGRHGAAPADDHGSRPGEADRSTFLERVRAEFRLPADVDEGAILSDDLDFDSLRLIELVTFVEEQAGCGGSDVPEEYPLLTTLGDAMAYFDELRASPADGDRAAGGPASPGAPGAPG